MGTVGENVRRLREKEGWSQARLAKEMGVKSQNTVMAIEAGGGTKHIYKLARIFKVSPSDIDPNAEPYESLMVPGTELVGPADMNLYASTEGGEGEIVVSNEPIGKIKRPAPLADVKGGFGVIVRGNSMVPVIRPGDTVLIHPHIPPQVEDICIFFSEKEGEFRATLKEYRGQTKDAWKVRRYQPKETDFLLKKSNFDKCVVVVGSYRRR